MVKVNKQKIKSKLFISMAIFIFLMSLYGMTINKVFANDGGIIQLNGMKRVEDGYAWYTTPMDTNTEVGRIIGLTEGAKDVGNPSSHDGQTAYEYKDLDYGTYKFLAKAENGYKLNNVMVNGSQVTVTKVENTENDYTFDIVVNGGAPVIINPSFSNNGGNNPGDPFDPNNHGDPNDPNNPGNPNNPQPGQSNAKIWIGNELVIDETSQTPKTYAEGEGWKIERGAFHINYSLKFLNQGSSIDALKVEGDVYLEIQMATVPEGSNVANILPNVIRANQEGYSIIGNAQGSHVNIETSVNNYGYLNLNGGINISGYFGAMNSEITIGNLTSRSLKGITASNIITEFGTLKIYTSDSIFNNLQSLDVFGNGKVEGNTNSTNVAFNNVRGVKVATSGKINITHGGNLGTFNKSAEYYEFCDFSNTRKEGDSISKLMMINLVNDSDSNEKAQMTTNQKSFELKSLAKTMYTVSFNMRAENGDLIEDTKVEHGTVKVLAACGAGYAPTDEVCTDFKIEEGSNVKIYLLPDYGYQFSMGSINGQKVNASTDENGVGVYTFNMPANHLHLNAKFVKADDNIVLDNEKIVDAKIGNLDGQINGTAEFKVDEAKNVDEDKFKGNNKDLDVVQYLDLSLTQVINKGNLEDAWKTKITDLNKDMKVTLKVSDDIAKQLENNTECKMIRNHNEKVEQLDATYDSSKKEITFNTNGYSTYAIAYKTKEDVVKTDKKNESISPKTGDSIIFVIAILSSAIIINVCITKKLKKEEKRVINEKKNK